MTYADSATTVYISGWPFPVYTPYTPTARGAVRPRDPRASSAPEEDA